MLLETPLIKDKTSSWDSSCNNTNEEVPGRTEFVGTFATTEIYFQPLEVSVSLEYQVAFDSPALHRNTNNYPVNYDFPSG